jgi:D-aminoacyl-tRNA deacylase
MRAVVQRVEDASVSVDGEVVGAIGSGLLVYLGVAADDVEADADYLAGKTANLRIFPDDGGTMNRSVLETSGAILVISQFTLLGDARKGRRPSYGEAAGPETAEPLYESFVASLKTLGLEVATGRFQTHMKVRYVNDGPITILLDSRKTF